MFWDLHSRHIHHCVYIYIPRSSQGFPFLTSFAKGAFLESEAVFYIRGVFWFLDIFPFGGSLPLSITLQSGQPQEHPWFSHVQVNGSLAQRAGFWKHGSNGGSVAPKALKNKTSNSGIWIPHSECSSNKIHKILFKAYKRISDSYPVPQLWFSFPPFACAMVWWSKLGYGWMSRRTVVFKGWPIITLPVVVLFKTHPKKNLESGQFYCRILSINNLQNYTDERWTCPVSWEASGETLGWNAKLARRVIGIPSGSSEVLLPPASPNKYSSIVGNTADSLFSSFKCHWG